MTILSLLPTIFYFFNLLKEVTLMEIILALALLAVAALLSVVVILLLAELGAYFLKPEQGTTTFISKGDSMHAIIPNVGGYKLSSAEDLDGRRWLVPEKDAKERLDALFRDAMQGTVWFQKWLWKKFGVLFISFWWPQRHKQKFRISRLRLKEMSHVPEQKTETSLEGESPVAKIPNNIPLRDYIERSPEPPEVSNLLFLVPRPVYVHGVELAGDNSKINLLVLPVFRQVVPELPVYYYKGDFFTPLDGAIRAALIDFFAVHRIAVYRKDSDEGKAGEFAEGCYILPHNQQEGETIEAYKERRKEEEAKQKEKYAPAPLTYAHWLRLSRSGDESPIEQHLRPLNVSRGYYRQLKKVADEERKPTGYSAKDELVAYVEELTRGQFQDISEAVATPSGIVPRFGFALISFRIIDWEAHEDSLELAQALRAEETQRHLAEGVRREAEGERDAILARATGESSRYNQLVTALIDKGVSANVAAGVIETDFRTANIGSASSKVTAYVEGDSGSTRANVMIPTSSSESSN